MQPEETEIVVLGGGLSGLAAAASLGNRAVTLERNRRPGGLAQTVRFEGYWFDHVLHLLYFSDERTETYIKALLGDQLAWCPPEAWVETPLGTVRYPFQMHLAGFGAELANRCLEDLAEVSRTPLARPPENFEELLLATFGRSMCDVFLLPYNRKLWKRPLSSLAPSGFQWTIAHPDFEQVRKGAQATSAGYAAYNSRGWYPRPAREAPVRGMEVLAQALAGQVADLRLDHAVESIDLETRTVLVRHRGDQLAFRYTQACVSTLALPDMLALCRQTPDTLRAAAGRLARNRVMTVALAIRGPRPESSGHWRSYSDPSLVFTRLVFMHAFDPDAAPEDGWGVLAEITEPAEAPLCPTDELVRRVQDDVRRVLPFTSRSRIIGAHVICIDPAYVVFTLDTADVVKRSMEFLRSHGVEPLGRYGRWEYSSMSQVMRDGFQLGDAMNRAGS